MSMEKHYKLSQEELVEKARQLRLEILEMTTNAGSGHPSSSWSAVEIVTALYFGGILRFRPEDPWWPNRDRFIMSKGHAAPLLYAALAHAGYFSREELSRLREIDSPVQGHPIQGMMPGIEATTGSLGQGLSLGLGQSWEDACPIRILGCMSFSGTVNVRQGRFGKLPWQQLIIKRGIWLRFLITTNIKKLDQSAGKLPWNR